MLSRSARLSLLCLAVALAMVPLAVHKPGLPSGLRSDEPAYYLMGLSLAHDFDLRCEAKDLARLFEEFPYDAARNVILMTDDGWHTVYYGKPFVYPLVAAPFAWLFGANGFVALNMLLVAGMIALGTRYLARYNAEPVALLFSAGFFLLSTAPVYAFWIHPEVFNMAAICACLYLGLTPAPPARPVERAIDRLRSLLVSPMARFVASGAVVALAGYGKPIYAALGVPVLVPLLRERRWREIVAWGGGLVGTLLLLGGISAAMTGHPSAYLGVERAGVRVEAPGKLVDVAVRDVVPEAPKVTTNSWSWIVYLPTDGLRKLPESALYFLVGRHTGLFPYLPFSALCLVLFLLHARRSLDRWAILASLAGVALFFLLFIDFNWHGGGGFVGNRYFVSAYPGFLFLVTRIAPTALVPLGWAIAALLTGPLQLAPFGAPVVHPTLQWHVRNAPFGIFPLELSLQRQIPGYRGDAVAGAWIYSRKDVFLPWGDEMLVRARGTVELWLMSDWPLSSAVFEVTSLAADNRIALALGGERRELHFASADDAPQHLVFPLHGPTRITDPDGAPIYGYRMEVEAERGSPFPGAASDDAEFLAGARLVYSGSQQDLEADLYRVEWTRVDVPAATTAGRRFSVPVTVRNGSGGSWWAQGGAHVALAYHWRQADGSTTVFEGVRTRLPEDVAGGASATAVMTVEAPAAPGEYELVLDLVREGVTWFGDRRESNLWRRHVTVTP